MKIKPLKTQSQEEKKGKESLFFPVNDNPSEFNPLKGLTYQKLAAIFPELNKTDSELFFLIASWCHLNIEKGKPDKKGNYIGTRITRTAMANNKGWCLKTITRKTEKLNRLNLITRKRGYQYGRKIRNSIKGDSSWFYEVNYQAIEKRIFLNRDKVSNLIYFKPKQNLKLEKNVPPLFISKNLIPYRNKNKILTNVSKKIQGVYVEKPFEEDFFVNPVEDEWGSLPNDFLLDKGDVDELLKATGLDLFQTKVLFERFKAYHLKRNTLFRSIGDAWRGWVLYAKDSGYLTFRSVRKRIRQLKLQKYNPDRLLASICGARVAVIAANDDYIKEASRGYYTKPSRKLSDTMPGLTLEKTKAIKEQLAAIAATAKLKPAVWY